MKNTLIKWRNYVLGGAYKAFLKPIFWKNDPETVHDRMVGLGRILGRFGVLRFFTRVLFGYSHPNLKQNVLGINFDNPLGLAAGFDKNAELTQILPSVGFGFVEVGSITGYACVGNDKPRLWRLPNSKGLLVHYGLKNDGVDVVAARLKGQKFANRLGTSVAMTNIKENIDAKTAVDDYAKAFSGLVEIGDYFTINISCPNAFGGQPFASLHRLDYLLDILDEIETKKPVFIKLSPDLAWSEVDEILEVAKKHRVHGIICSNLTKNRQNIRILDKNLPEIGGVSGKPVQILSDRLISYIYKKEKGRFIIIGCGGIFSAEDAYKKIRLGASLLQMITGMIFEGPQVISEINRGLVKLLKQDGFQNIAEAVGIDSI